MKNIKDIIDTEDGVILELISPAGKTVNISNMDADNYWGYEVRFLEFVPEIAGLVRASGYYRAFAKAQVVMEGQANEEDIVRIYNGMVALQLI